MYMDSVSVLTSNDIQLYLELFEQQSHRSLFAILNKCTNILSNSNIRIHLKAYVNLSHTIRAL